MPGDCWVSVIIICEGEWFCWWHQSLKLWSISQWVVFVSSLLIVLLWGSTSVKMAVQENTYWMFQVKYQKDNFSHWSKHYSITLEKTVSCLQQLLKSFKNNLLKIIYAGYLLQLKLFFKNNTFCQGRPFTYIESSNS